MLKSTIIWLSLQFLKVLFTFLKALIGCNFKKMANTPFKACDKLDNYIQTRVLERFALIFYLNCEHVLFVYI